MEPHPSTVLLRKLREQFQVFAEFKPLKLGIHGDLAARQVAPSDELRNVLARQTRDRRYLRNVVAGGPRYDLDFHPSGLVSIAERRFAAGRLGLKTTSIPGMEAETRAKPPIEELIMQANTIKVSLTITDFERHLDVVSTGASSVPVIVETSGGTLKATLNPKSFRKAQAAFKELNGQAAVLISGEFDIAGGTIKSAGIMVQPKKPKEPMGQA